MSNQKNPFSNAYISDSGQITERETDRNKSINDTDNDFLKDVKPNKPSRIIIRAKIV